MTPTPERAAFPPIHCACVSFNAHECAQLWYREASLTDECGCACHDDDDHWEYDDDQH